MDTLALHGWYVKHGRTLPWRSDPTPYYVLLSEFMCQQTRVETALPYFEAFRTRWPTLDALAAASEEEVVEAWAGLGYYSRARRLHGVARAAVSRGGLPSTAAELQQLPGIGPYTAGAIASIAFGQAVPAVDGNVDRVLARHRGITLEVDRPAGKRAVREEADALHQGLVPPGDLNQALMELGATHCSPRSPSCSSCPVLTSCVAHEQDLVAELPRKRPKKKAVRIEGVAAVLRQNDRTLLVKRRGTGLLGGLWTPPLKMDVPLDAVEALVEACGAAGIRVDSVRPVATIRHVFSHRDLSLRVYDITGEVVGDTTEPWSESTWTSAGLGLSRLAAKVLEASESARVDAPLLAADGSS